MKRFHPVLLLLYGYASFVRAQNGIPAPAPGPGASPEPRNLAYSIESVVRYHDSGEYERAIQLVAKSAEEYLANRVAHRRPNENLVAVFDIDETALSNWATLFDCGFCSYSTQVRFYPPPAHDPAIPPVLHLFNFAREKGIAVFFVTGRQEDQRARTVSNLQEAGYSGWTGLMMQQAGNRDPASVFKPRDRQQIVAQGYTIALNIGDQASDLVGCCAERGFKLPNPFYLIK